MRVLIASDKFKGSLTAIEACQAMSDAILTNYPDAQIEILPLADGGEGTGELLTLHTYGKMIDVTVTGPLPQNVWATYGISGDGKYAFIESAKASGLQLLSSQKRNPLLTTTFGTGELIAEALRSGVKNIVLGIGGTATNDAGIGMAAALGFRFLDAKGRSLDAIGKNLIHLQTIIPPNDDSLLKASHVVALCDVDNPLYGPRGAAHTYGPQKGADEEALKLLDDGLKNFERVVKDSLSKEANFPGAGAGGGLASGAKVFLNADIRKGMEYIAEITELEQKIKSADLILTGEGKIDTQTLAGKVVGTVASLARKHNKKVIAVCGVCELREIELQKIGVTKVVCLVDPFVTVQQAMATAGSLIISKLQPGF